MLALSKSGYGDHKYTATFAFTGRRRFHVLRREKKIILTRGQTTLAHLKRSIHLRNEYNLLVNEPPPMHVIYWPRIGSDRTIPASNWQIIQLRLQSEREGRRRRHGKREPAQLQLDSQSVFPVKKPSKTVVWRLQSWFNFQPLPAAFQAPPSIYLFWIIVISPPRVPALHRRMEPRWQRRRDPWAPLCTQLIRPK